MAPVDIIIVVFALLMAVWGFAQGLIVGALSLGGFAIGVVLGARLGPLLLEEGSRSPYASLFALGGALFLGIVLAGILEAIGGNLRESIGDRLGVLDGLGGAALLACVGLGLAWIGGAVAMQTPGPRDVRQEVRRSKIIQALNQTLPPSGAVLNLLARFDPFPRVEGAAPDVEPPTGRILRDPDVRAAGRSVVRVLGTACGLGVQGSGWAAGDGEIVTNAHVIAGQDDTSVQLRDGSRHDADAIWFDSRNDLAILRASGARGLAALPIDSDPDTGTSASILGYPENGPFVARAARIGPTATILADDAYGRGPFRRRITSLRGRVRSGNSGGPAVDGRGRVATTVFAASTGERGGFGVPSAVVRRALGRANGLVDTGPCSR